MTSQSDVLIRSKSLVSPMLITFTSSFFSSSIRRRTIFFLFVIFISSIKDIDISISPDATVAKKYLAEWCKYFLLDVQRVVSIRSMTFILICPMHLLICRLSRMIFLTELISTRNYQHIKKSFLVVFLHILRKEEEKKNCQKPFSSDNIIYWHVIHQFNWIFHVVGMPNAKIFSKTNETRRRWISPVQVRKRKERSLKTYSQWD